MTEQSHTTAQPPARGAPARLSSGEHNKFVSACVAALTSLGDY